MSPHDGPPLIAPSGARWVGRSARHFWQSHGTMFPTAKGETSGSLPQTLRVLGSIRPHPSAGAAAGALVAARLGRWRAFRTRAATSPTNQRTPRTAALSLPAHLEREDQHTA